MLNWLFSSFTYLPNFIIWLPSFSSPWLVQLASKCHLAIFAFGRFLDFFHSVKKVSKPRIFCKIICVSERTLVILIRMLRNFVFSFICMIYKWGGDFIEGNFPKGGIFTKGNFLRGNSMGVIFTGGNLIRIWVLAKSKKENYDPAHKMVEKFGKSRVYQFV